MAKKNVSTNPPLPARTAAPRPAERRARHAFDGRGVELLKWFSCRGSALCLSEANVDSGIICRFGARTRYCSSCSGFSLSARRTCGVTS